MLSGSDMPASAPATVVTADRGRQTVFWVIAILLAVIATALVLRLDERSMGGHAALAQAPAGTGAGRLGARGIYAFSGPVTRSTFGVFMLDVDTGTLWCYELVPGPGGAKQMKLVAARSWIFDRYLEEFNVAEPTPSAVADLVEKQVSQRSRARATTPANEPDESVVPPENDGSPGGGDSEAQ